jgi:hypothetical protein
LDHSQSAGLIGRFPGGLQPSVKPGFRRKFVELFGVAINLRRRHEYKGFHASPAHGAGTVNCVERIAVLLRDGMRANKKGADGPFERKSPAAVATVVSITSTPIPISVSTISPDAIAAISIDRGSTDATVRATNYSNVLNVWCPYENGERHC